MLSERLTLGLKAVLGLLPVFYSGLLIALLPNTFQWLLITGAAMLGLLLLAVIFDIPVRAAWPAFLGMLLVVACSAALFQARMSQGPITHSPDELMAIYPLAALYVAWGAWATWRAARMFPA